MLPVFRDHEALHEVSGVKVPRPASSFITHETIVLPMEMTVAVSRGISRACRRTPSEVIDTSDPSLPLLFYLHFDFDSFPCPDCLLGQFHQVPHEFVQIE